MFEAKLWDTIERLSSSYSGSELGGSLTNLSSTLCDDKVKCKGSFLVVVSKCYSLLSGSWFMSCLFLNCVMGPTAEDDVICNPSRSNLSCDYNEHRFLVLVLLWLLLRKGVETSLRKLW